MVSTLVEMMTKASGDPSPHWLFLVLLLGTVHSISAGQACDGKSGVYTSAIWGKDWLEQVVKNALKAFAFSDAVHIIIPL